MTTLLHPTTGQPCAFVGVERGHVKLALSCTVTPATQWFPIEAIERANPVHTCQEPPKPLTVVLTPELAANVGVVIVVRKPVTLYHESMAA